MRRVGVAFVTGALALVLNSSTVVAAPAWWARTGVASYNPVVGAAGVDVYYTCPEPDQMYTGTLRVEMKQGDVRGDTLWPAGCPTSGRERDHVGVYPEVGDAFDPDRLAQVRVHIGQSIIGGGNLYIEYTSEWRTVCLHGGSAELCPQ
jgi:hypothetical protein